MNFFSLLVPLFCCFVATHAKKKKNYVFVQALWRHGDRAPSDLPYPLDNNTEDHWRRGWGQLTALGMNQLRDLGKFFRKRYKGFASKHFVASEAYMLSSEKDRAIVSAQAFLYGMYPAKGKFEFRPSLNWQPLPVHSATPGSDDLLCHGTSFPCPLAEDLYTADDARSAEKYNKEYADVFSFLAPVTGIQNFSFYDINSIFNVNREVIHNMTEPAWINKRWSTHANQTTIEIGTWMRAERFMNKIIYICNRPSFSAEILQFQAFAGYLLNTWIQDSLLAAKGEPMPKFKWYSSHDTVQTALMYAMGIGNGIMPPYAAALIWELHNNDGQFEVELYYRNDTSSKKPVPIDIPGCGSPCLLTKLPEIYGNATLSTVEDVEKFCNSTVQS